jgi:predicted molibdopterin-dependent oxidoreductase YjgC
MIGRGAMSNPLVDMEKPDAIFCIGTNMTECHPVAATSLKKALARGAKLIVADPRRIKLAELADLYLPIRVGTDVALLLAMAHVIDRDGLIAREYIEKRTTSSEEFLAHVRKFPPSRMAEICGVPAADIERAARWYGAAERGAIYYTLGITEHSCGVDNVQSLGNLALMTGNLGVEGAGLNPMRGQNNVQGCGDAGALPGYFPGYQPVTDPENQRTFERLYGWKIDARPLSNKVDAVEQMLAGEIRAVLINGENTLVSDADRDHSERALRSLDTLVVIDIFPTETAAIADVVLPATAWGETDGVFTNTERRVQRVRAAVPPQGEARPDWWITSEIAKRCGFPGFEYGSAKDVFEELCSVSPHYAGLDWDAVAEGKYQWPVPHRGHPGTPMLHEHEFPSGRGTFKIIRYRGPAEITSADYPLWLTTGRRLESYHTRTQTGRAQGIDYVLREESLEVNPEDVERLGLVDGGWCRMTSTRGSVRVRIEQTERTQPGLVFCSFAFSEVKVTPVRLELAEVSEPRRPKRGSATP